MKPVLQLALDFVNMDRALKAAHAAVEGGADWLEAGTPLIKSEGLDSVRALRREYPSHKIIADMKTMDAGRGEMEIAAKAGANIGVVMAAASESTVRECIEAGRNYGIETALDLLGTQDPVAVARGAAALGIDYIIVHCPIDDQMQGKDPFELLRTIRAEVATPLAVAGGINSENAAQAVEAGADVVIVGGAITKSKDPARAAKDIKQAMETGKPVATKLYKRVIEEHVAEALTAASTANISDGNHRLPALAGIWPIFPGIKMVGRAVTVRAYPGDWAKPVQAIDVAREGDVIVIDAGGVGPALWGELATLSAKQKGLAGVVIDGAIRDTAEIKQMAFPAFARIIQSNAGEPKGMGEINVPVTISGTKVLPGDWLVGDDDGVIVLSKNRIAEMANRGMECREKENRIRREIEEGRTSLGEVLHLLKWEKQ